MKTRLIIIRHGETLYNVRGLFQGQLDTELTDKGRRQAESAAKRLRKTKFDALYSSPLQRAYETARIVKGGRDISITKDNSIIEIKCGNWEGREICEIKENDNEDFLRWENEPHLYCIPGGETFSQVYERVSRFLKKAIEEHKGQTVVIVSHMVAIMLMLTYLLGKGIENVWSIGRQPNAAINILEVDEHGLVDLIAIGDDSHIEESTFPEWEPELADNTIVS